MSVRAIQVREFGGPEVLVPSDLPAPSAGNREVVVGLDVADVGFLDMLLRSGWGRDLFPRELPYVPGDGGAGRVLAAGEGADPALVGRRVVVNAPGGYAEQVVAGVDDLVVVPDGLGTEEAAAVLHDGVTALMLDRAAEATEGEWVLVASATGGAGSLLMQLLRHRGARLVAAARGAAKLAAARELGAELAVDYSEPGWRDAVREAIGRGVDVAFDGAGGELGRQVFGVVADGGRFVTYGTSTGEFADIDPRLADQRQVRATNLLASGPPSQALRRETLTEALALAARGTIRPVIGATYPLDDAVKAHTALAERTTIGKSLLLV